MVNNANHVNRDDWFSVSADGIGQHYKKTYISRELLANSFDEDVETIIFTIETAKTVKFPNQFLIRIIDDDPSGFDSIEDMFTLFRKTKKVDDTQVRGRFNHGEKGVLSLCNKAILTSTKGTVKFNPSGKRIIDLTTKTDKGSDLRFWIDLNKTELSYLQKYPKLIKIPKGIKVIYCDNEYQFEEPEFIVESKLQTWKSDQKKSYYKKTKVCIYPKVRNIAYIMELGIPIQRINYPFTVDVRQKIPLDTKRNSVKNTYLEDLYGQLANHDFFIDEIEDDDLGEDFIAITLSSKEINSESAKRIVQKKMGSDKIMISNPFDQKANEKAVESGYTLIKSKDIPKASREAIKEAGIQTTSEVFKINLVSGKQIPQSQWSKGMIWIEDLSKKFALFSINRNISVAFFDNPDTSENASYGTGSLNYNMGNLGKDFFDLENNIGRISSLLIHELSHDLKIRLDLPHLSNKYIRELERISGKMVEWLLISVNLDLMKRN